MHSPFLPFTSRRHPSVPRQIIIQAAAPRIEPIAFEDWPIWLKIIVHHSRQPQDIGLGDTMVHLIGDARSESFKKWYHEKFGESCGCTDRQRYLNLRYPYSSSPAAAHLPPT